MKNAFIVFTLMFIVIKHPIIERKILAIEYYSKTFRIIHKDLIKALKEDILLAILLVNFIKVSYINKHFLSCLLTLKKGNAIVNA